MKRNLNILRCGLLLGAMICSPAAFAQATYEISDGGQLNLDVGTWTDVFTTRTVDNSATGILNANGAVTFQGTLSDFYGVLKVGSGYSLIFNPVNSSTPAKVNMSGLSSTTTFTKKGGALTLSGDISDKTFTMGDYAVLDLTDAANSSTLTLAKSLYLSSHGANAGQIKFSADPAKGIVITAGNIYSDDTDGQLSGSKHVTVDFTSTGASYPTYGDTSTFTLATGSSAFVLKSGDATPTVTGNDEGIWTTFVLSAVNAGGGVYNLKVSATFNGALFVDNTSTYRGSFTSLMTADGVTSGTLLKNWANLTGDQFVSKNILIDLSTYNITDTVNAFTIGSSKNFSLMRSSSGVFGGKVKFSDSSSTVVAIGAGALSDGFTVDASSSSAGMIVIGDGTTASTQTIDPTLLANLNNKVSKVRVNGNATVTLSK